MSDHQRLDDMPGPLRWFLITYKQVGFPMLVCAFLAYMYFIEQAKSRQSVNEFKEMFMKQTEVISSLKTSIDQQNKLLRHKRTNE